MIITNSSALVVPAQPAATNAAPGPVFTEAPKPLIYISDWQMLIVWIIALLALAVGAYFLVKWWRKKVVAPPPPPPPAHVRARRKLEKALLMISDPKQFTILVSQAIREYLEERFDFHAPERTTEEFLYELQGSMLLTRDQKDSLVDFLASCDLIKFAKYEPTETELRGLYEAALRLVNDAEPRVNPAEPPPVPVPSSTP